MGDKRRDNGDGSVYQDKNGYWRGYYKPNKSSKPKYFSGKTESEVKKKVREFKNNVIKNDYVAVKKITVKDFMDRWLFDVKFYELKPTSFDTLEMTCSRIYTHIGDIQIGSLTSDDVQKLINAFADRDLSYSVIKKAYDAINSCFKWALSQTPPKVAVNPCVGVKLPTRLQNTSKRKRMQDIRFFTDDEIEKIYVAGTAPFIEGVSGYRLGNAIVLLLYTGMRRGELLGLKWDKVDFENNTITVTDTVVMIKNRSENAKTKKKILHQDSTKSYSGERVIPLAPRALDALKELQKLNGNSEYVVATAKGTPVMPTVLYQMFRRLLSSCGIEECGLHTLRHTFASMLFKKGVDAKTVSELLGHSDVSLTYNTYIHLIKEQKREAIALLATL